MGKRKRSRGSFSIAINTPQAAKLRDVVHQKLSEFMGDYPDMVLAEYVVVLVCNGKHQLQAMEDLDAFLGDESGAFVAWLWDHLAANTHIYTASSQMLRSVEGTTLDEKEKSNYEKQTKEWSKEELRRTHDKPKQNVHTKLMIKRSLVSTLSHEDSKAKHIEVIETLQRGCMGADSSFSMERRKIQRLKPSQYVHADFIEDENDQHNDLKCSSHLKGQHTADFSSYRDHSVQDVKFANKRIISSPCIVAPHHLLQSAVREVVSPSGLASSKHFESEIKLLQSVVVENPDAARDTVGVPHISNPHRISVPSTTIAMCMADVTNENNIARVRPARSVWDRLGNPLSEEVNGFEQEMDEHMKGIGKKQEMESIFLEQGNGDCEHEGWFGVHGQSDRGPLNRLYKDFTKDRAISENKNIEPITNGEGYRELWEDVSKRYIHANTTSSMGNKQRGYKQAKHPLKLIDKDHEEPVTLEYKLSQSLNKSTSESKKRNTSSFRAADTSQKIVNISVNVNTWKQAHLESMKGAVDEEAVVSSTSWQRLQDQPEMSVDDVLPDKKETGLLKESEQLTHALEKNDVATIRSRLCKVELEMANLRAKQAKFCKDVPNAGIQSLLLDSEDNLDSRTVFVNNVHFAATKEALSSHFSQCGEVLKVIVLTDVTTGQPKGSAYIMFASGEAAERALLLNNTSYMLRMLKVVPKTDSHFEASPSFVQPSLQSPLTRPVRSMARAAYPRGSQCAFRKSSLHITNTGSQHFQWRRDVSTGGSNKNPEIAPASLNGSTAVSSSVPVANGKLPTSGSVQFTRSLSYTKAPTETLIESPAPT